MRPHTWTVAPKLVQALDKGLGSVEFFARLEVSGNGREILIYVLVRV